MGAKDQIGSSVCKTGSLPAFTLGPYFWFWGATTSNAQGLLLALLSEITLRIAQGNI